MHPTSNVASDTESGREGCKTAKGFDFMEELAKAAPRAINGTNKRTTDDAMAGLVLTEMTASVSELKRDPMGTVASGEGAAVAILNRNETAFYCIPAKAYEALMDRLEDIELNAIADARQEGPFVRVTLDEL